MVPWWLILPDDTVDASEIRLPHQLRKGSLSSLLTRVFLHPNGGDITGFLVAINSTT